MKILKLNEFINESSVFGDSVFDKELKHGFLNRNNPTLALILLSACVHGTSPDIVSDDGRRIPITHETFKIIFKDDPHFKNYTVDEALAGIDKYLHNHAIYKWKYPHNEDAANDHSRNDWKTYDWTLDELNDD